MSKRVTPKENERRIAVAFTLRNELGMTYKQIGNYMGLHFTSVRHLLDHGSTSSLSNLSQRGLVRYKINPSTSTHTSSGFTF